MSVLFESTIKIDENKDWYIKLVDTVDGREVICKNLEEYSKSIEDFGSDYGGNIDEVKWLKDDEVTPQIMDEIRFEMAKHQADIEERKGETKT